MKKIGILIVILFVVILAMISCKKQRNYEIPFVADDVESITVSIPEELKCKVISDANGIQYLLSLFEKMNVQSLYRDQQDLGLEGAFGNTYIFQLSDGTELEVHAVHLRYYKVLFVDENGTKYLVRNFNPQKIWNLLDYEIQEYEHNPS